MIATMNWQTNRRFQKVALQPKVSLPSPSANPGPPSESVYFLFPRKEPHEN